MNRFDRKVAKILKEVANNESFPVTNGCSHGMFANTSSVSQMPSLAELESQWNDFYLEHWGAHLDRIVFRDQREIAPWVEQLKRYMESKGERTDCAPESILPAIFTGIPLVVDPELQGPSPKLVKRLGI